MSRVEGPVLPSTPPHQPTNGPTLPSPSSPSSSPSSPSTSQPPPHPLSDPTHILSRTVTIFDWDDTLLPSSYLHSLNYRVDLVCPFPKNLSHSLATLSTTIINTLNLAKTHGKILIITNAETGWVQLSAQRFLPKVLDYIKAHSIKIVSARSEFESEFPMPVLWKTAAFSREIARLYHQNEGSVNVISIGDSWCERLAARAFGECRGGCWIKTVKFVEMCNITDVERMVKLVKQAWNDLRSHQASFDVNLRL